MTVFASRILRPLVALVLALLALHVTAAHAQLHKCIDNGAVTYQNTACQPGAPSQRPTVEQLNAQRKKQMAQAKEAPAARSAGPSDVGSRTGFGIDAATSGTLDAPKPAQHASPPTPPTQNFSCDGRKYCSQMTSCAEATYFLAHCPGVKMDGGQRNGIPCEQQWCHK